MNTPRVGDIVIYQVSPHDRVEITFNAAHELPAIVVAVWKESVNLQIFTNTPVQTSWKEAVKYGQEPGQWRFRDKEA